MFIGGNLSCVPLDGQLRLAGVTSLISDQGSLDYWGSLQLIKSFNEMGKILQYHIDF